MDDNVRFSWPNPRTGDPQPTPWNKLDAAWFTRVEQGASMTRTVSMDGLGRVLPGKYECTFVFRSPHRAPKFLRGLMPVGAKSDEPLKDGRVWLGRITAERIAELPGK